MNQEWVEDWVGECGEWSCVVHSMKTEESLEILPSKNWRKDDASWGSGVPVGRIFGDFRESKELSADQSWRG